MLRIALLSLACLLLLGNCGRPLPVGLLCDADADCRGSLRCIQGTCTSCAEGQCSSQTEPKTEPKAEPRTEARAESQAEPKAEPKVEPRTEARAEPQTEPRSEPRAEPKAEPRAEPRAEPKSELPSEAGEPTPEPPPEPRRVCNPGGRESCFVGGKPYAIDKGPCKKGTRTCDPQGNWGACTNGVGPSAELCDGIDNDCDGSVDEDFPQLKKACEVGKGACLRKGSYACSSDGKAATCNATPGTPSKELCNGKDDDCDGRTDEDLYCTRIVADGLGLNTAITAMELSPQDELYVAGPIFIPPHRRFGKQFFWKFTRSSTGQFRIQTTDKYNTETFAAPVRHPMDLAMFGSQGQLLMANNVGGPYISLFTPGAKPTLKPFLGPVPGPTSPKPIDGPLSTARTQSCFALAVAPHGVVYFTENYEHLLRMIVPPVQGKCPGGASTTEKWCVVTLVGDRLNPKKGFKDGPASSALLHSPSGIAIDRAGDVYVSEVSNHSVRKISFRNNEPCGTNPNYTGYCVTTFAHRTSSGANHFKEPLDMAFDNYGNLYVMDSRNFAVKKIATDGKISLIAGGYDSQSGGNLLTASSARTPGTQVNLFRPQSSNSLLASPVEAVYDAKRHLLLVGVREYIYEIQLNRCQSHESLCDGKDDDCNGKIDEGLYCTRVILDGLGGDSAAVSAIDVTPQGLLVLAMQSYGSNKKEAVLTYKLGDKDPINLTTAQSFPTRTPLGLAAFGPSGDFLSGNIDNHAIYHYSAPSKKGALFAGKNTQVGEPGSADGPTLTPNTARFDRPEGLAVDGNGVIYVADKNNDLIRKIEKLSNATCGTQSNYTGYCVTTLAGQKGAKSLADGPANLARFHAPSGVAVDGKGAIYVADQLNHSVRKIEKLSNATCGTQTNYSGYCVTTLAGAKAPGYVDAKAGAARFNRPVKLVVDKFDNVYVTDHENEVIRKIDPAGEVTTIAGGARLLYKLQRGGRALRGDLVQFQGQHAKPRRLTVLGLGYDKSRHVLYVGSGAFVFEIQLQ